MLGAAALALSIFVLKPDLFDQSPRKVYRTVLKDASGILAKTHVKTNGVIVGKVKSITLLESATEVAFEVEDHVKIPAGSQIEVQTVGFLGDKFLDIKRPEGSSAELLSSGQMIPQAEGKMSLNEVISLAGDIAKDVKQVSATLATVLGGDSGERSIQAIVDNLEDLLANANGLVQENRDGLRETIAEFRKFAGSLNDVMNQQNKERIDRILASFDESMVEVKGASRNINLISQKVESGEGTIGRLVNDDKALTELEAAIKDIRKVLSPAKKMEVVVDYHNELRRFGSNQNYFNLKLIPRPDSYYILGFTDRTFSEEDTFTTTSGPNSNGETVKRERIKSTRALRYNLQFAKRWHFAAVRFGLFESTGGFGTDFYFWRDRLRLTFEAFEFADKKEPIRSFAHLKAYASVLFFDHIQVLAGLDDPTLYKPGTETIDPKLNTFFGVGVTFSDQDLKALFGLASLASP